MASDRLIAALPLQLILLVGFAAVALLVLGIRRLAHARAMADSPQSRIRSAAQGEIELLGRGRWMPGPPIRSPLSGSPCVWWHYRIVCIRGRDSEVVADETSDDLFYLTDSSGDCIVDPVGARIEPSLSRRWRGTAERPGRIPNPGWDAFFTFGRYHYRERLIRVDDLMIARGWFRTQAAAQELDESGDLAVLLGEWKRDRRNLLRRFDANHDNLIDQQEWEIARTAALAEIRAQHAGDRAPPDLNILSRAPGGGEFLLAARPRLDVIAHDLRIGWTLLGLSVLAALLAIDALHAHGML